MEHPPEPTTQQCSALAYSEWQGRRCLALWYPQMGGYVGKCVAALDESGCFDVWVWHDGEFPFSDESPDGARAPVELHHCDPEQFIQFGTELKRALLA